MKRVAIPINDGKLSEYFGKCSHYKIFEIDGKSVNEKVYEIPKDRSIDELPAWASEKGITDIITYKIDKQIISLFTRYKINLFVGIHIDAPEKLMNEFLNETITSNHKIISEIMGRE